MTTKKNFQDINKLLENIRVTATKDGRCNAEKKNQFLRLSYWRK